MNRSKLGAVGALAALLVIGGATSFPLLAVGLGDPAAAGTTCPGNVTVSDDGSPTILGPSTLTVAAIRSWWNSTGRGQPARLRVPVADVIALYLSEGDAEGVRGDLAFAQAVLETGYFTNSDTARNNFAGIAHYDNAASGRPFIDPIIGVRAQIQLLKKYAAGNSVALAHPDIAPRAGASATTWAGLAGRWATDPNYWTSMRTIYERMAATVTTTAPSAATTVPGARAACEVGSAPALVGHYTLPVDRHWYDEHPDWFTRPHHDYPAIDIPVPVGTPLYAVTDGVVVGTPSSGKCGIGIILDGDDDARYTYCHGRPGSQAVHIGDRVTAGQHILDSASTGNSTGPHLHFGIEIDGTRRCPQAFLAAIAQVRERKPSDSLTTACTS